MYKKLTIGVAADESVTKKWTICIATNSMRPQPFGAPVSDVLKNQLTAISTSIKQHIIFFDIFSL